MPILPAPSGGASRSAAPGWSHPVRGVMWRRRCVSQGALSFSNFFSPSCAGLTMSASAMCHRALRCRLVVALPV